MNVIALAIIFCAVVLFIVWKRQTEQNADLKAPVLSEHALIHVKESTMARRYSPPDYYLYFFIPERDTVEQCQVSKNVYDSFEKGDWGTLTHQGSIFLFFTKDS